MKIVKIFGFVVAVHAAVFLLIFAIPGCRSSARKASDASGPQGPASVTMAGGAPTATGGDGYASSRPFGINATETIRPVAFSGPAGVRYSPTRPATADGVSGPAPIAMTPSAPEPAPTVSYTVVKGDSLWSVAKKHGLTVAELARANNLSNNASLRLSQNLVIPSAAVVTPSALGAMAVAPEVERTSYTVQAGDNLGAIARRHGTTVAAIKSANRLTSDMVRPGQSLVMPGGSVAVASGEAVSAAPAAVPAPARTGGSITHVVAPGETVSEIARNYGISAREINVTNNITDPRALRAGQVLTIPGWQAPAGGASKAGASASTAPAAPPAPTTPAPVPAPEASSTPTINLIIPGANQGLPPAENNDVPVIRVEDSPAADGAPRIE